MIRAAFLSALEPPPTLTVSQWADQFRMLSPEASAEPGRWSTDRAPYQRAIMDALNDPDVTTVVVMSSAQVGKTEILCNAIGYRMDLDPGPMLLIQPTLEMAEAFSKDRIDPMLRDSPALRAKVSMNKRTASNTMRHKAFPGGHLTLAGSNSTAGLASRPIRDVFADEVDRWDVSDEGDPLALAKKRTNNFWNRKHVVVSTPTIKGASRIERDYLDSDQRRCFVPCPHCRERHVLEWQFVKFTNHDPSTAHLVCPACGCVIDEGGRAAMLREPEWRPSAPFHGIAGFHIWEAYSPWRRLSDIVADFLEAKKAPDTLQVFVNTSLGETWEEKADQADAHVLLARRQPYPAQVPKGACCLTMGVDVQDDRLEALVVGWGLGEECWIVDHRVLPGDPQRPEPWTALDAMLTESYLHESGAPLDIQATCIDTAGHRTEYAYAFVRPRQHRQVHAIIGRSGEGNAVLVHRSPAAGRRPTLHTIGVDACKSVIYSRLKVTEPGPSYVHLPLAHETKDKAYRFGVDEEFIAQLTAERLITKHRMGVPHRVWTQVRPRNEALDLFVYAIAALRILRPHLETLMSRLEPDRKPAPAAPVTKKDPWIGQRRPGGWLKGNR